jgi:hypothetical protein
MRTVSLKLPDHLVRELDAEAKARRITKSRLIRESLEQALHKRPQRRFVSAYDLARDVIGSLKGLHQDLATNPKYMEGFGE